MTHDRPAPEPQRDLGVQPLAARLAEHELEARHLVAASTEQLTHKMVQRGCRGRRLSPHVMRKVQRALNTAAAANHELDELFTYAKTAR